MPLDSSNSGASFESPDEFSGLRRFYFLKLKLLALPKETKQSENMDINFVIRTYLYVLFHKIYELHLQKKYMNKAQACAFIPFKHATSCFKYLELARRNQYIRFERDEADTRKHVVMPTQALIDFIEQDLDRFIHGAYNTIEKINDEISKEKRRQDSIEASFRLSVGHVFSDAKVKDQEAPPVRVLLPLKIKPKRFSYPRRSSKKNTPER
jgi:hypothetical protein